MKYFRRIVYGLPMLAMMNYVPLFCLVCMVSGQTALFTLRYWLLLLAVFLYINVRPLPKTAPTRRIQRLAEGAELPRRWRTAAGSWRNASGRSWRKPAAER